MDDTKGMCGLSIATLGDIHKAAQMGFIHLTGIFKVLKQDMWGC